MTFAQRPLFISLLALMCSGAALAADPPKADAPKADAAKADDKKADDKKADDKKAEDKKDGKEAKAEAPAEPDLPSKPYPKNAAPKAFAPKGEPKKSDEAVAAKPADKAGDKPAEKSAEKSAAKPADKAADKSADAQSMATAYQPGHDKPAMKKRRQAAAPAPKPVTDPAMAALARESLKRGAPGGAYQVKAGDNLDTVIRKTMPSSPFSVEVMREAYARANPQLLASVKAMRLKAGTMLTVPSAAVMSQVVLGDSAPQAEPVKASDLYTAAPVVAPSAPGSVSDQNRPIAIPRLAPDLPVPGPVAEVSPEEKKKWVRYP